MLLNTPTYLVRFAALGRGQDDGLYVSCLSAHVVKFAAFGRGQALHMRNSALYGAAGICADMTLRPCELN